MSNEIHNLQNCQICNLDLDFHFILVSCLDTERYTISTDYWCYKSVVTVKQDVTEPATECVRFQKVSFHNFQCINLSECRTLHKKNSFHA